MPNWEWPARATQIRRGKWDHLPKGGDPRSTPEGTSGTTAATADLRKPTGCSSDAAHPGCHAAQGSARSAWTYGGYPQCARCVRVDYGGYPQCARRVDYGGYPQCAHARKTTDGNRTEVLVSRWAARRPLKPHRGQGSAWTTGGYHAVRASA